MAWSPACIDKRCYNYTAIADACDFLFVMSYDEQSQIWTDCVAKANAPYLQTLVGEDKTLPRESEHFHFFTPVDRKGCFLTRQVFFVIVAVRL